MSARTRLDRANRKDHGTVPKAFQTRQGRVDVVQPINRHYVQLKSLDLAIEHRPYNVAKIQALAYQARADEKAIMGEQLMDQIAV
jgi:hypothetical protein